MRDLCSGQRRLNETLLLLSVARYSRTGMATIPKLMTPRQIERGIRHPQPLVLFCARLAARSVADRVKRAHWARGSGRIERAMRPLTLTERRWARRRGSDLSSL